MTIDIQYRKEFSRHLQRDMEYKIYGHQGKPMLVFPTASGRFFQFEDAGMLEAVRPFIEEGRIQVWACDGIDGETFFADHGNHDAKIKRYDEYDHYLSEELVPAILAASSASNGFPQKLLLTGCSMGAFHCTNFYFHHPETADTLIAMSGVYSTDSFFGSYRPLPVYQFSPIHYLRNLTDQALLQRYRQRRLIFCCGQGAWEGQMLADTHELAAVMQEKQIPAWFDYWGNDVSHDWQWWIREMKYFLPQVL
jgi:esterase/lipase superfamily enzyme